MTQFQTSTTVHNIDAENVLASMLAHLREHDLHALQKDNAWHIDYANTQITLQARENSLRATVQAVSPSALYEGRMLVFYHIQEFSQCEAQAIQWDGDKVELQYPPSFRVVTVAAVSNIGPHLRRVRFRADNLSRFESNDNIHCKLLLPQAGVENPEWPTLAANGVPQFPTGDKRLDMRTYTIRRINAAEGWFDIDFVLHADAGPGSGWAGQAKPGQQIGMSGTGGRTAPARRWMLLAGDETALPAIARISESLPANTIGRVIIEVQSANDQITLDMPKGMTVQWLHRGNAVAGTTTLLADAVQNCDISADDSRFVWVGAEFATAQSVRAWLRNTIGLGNKEQLVVAYWRYGMNETQMKKMPAKQASSKVEGQEAGS